MKRLFLLPYFTVFICGAMFAQVENHMSFSLLASTGGEVMLDFSPEWEIPFLQGESPLTSGNNVTLKLNTKLSPITAELTGNAVFTVLPFLTFNIGGMAGIGWNYDLFGRFPIIGLGINRKTAADDPNEGVIGNGLDGVMWNAHTGITLQFDFAAIFPGDWHHVVFQIYNEAQYFAYTKANDNDLWYYLDDEGMNRNAFRHRFSCLAGYAMPIFIDMVGVQFSGTLPFYNIETGADIRDIGYSLTSAVAVNFKINERFSIMSLAGFYNKLKVPVTSAYERKWKFADVMFIATWRIK
jgi:hypothetical protein